MLSGIICAEFVNEELAEAHTRNAQGGSKRDSDVVLQREPNHKERKEAKDPKDSFTPLRGLCGFLIITLIAVHWANVIDGNERFPPIADTPKRDTTVPMPRNDLDVLDRDGAIRFDRAALPVLSALDDALREYPSDDAGVRIHGNANLRPMLDPLGPIGALAAKAQGDVARPVRAILFNKTANANWSLGWHQDRTISVKERRNVEGFGPWTVKGDMNHVEPPFALLARMVTIRVHLDEVGEDNAPLLVAPGSHKVGRVTEDEIDNVVRRCGTMPCLAAAGDVWLYATPILHASKAATAPTTRRVLQVDYAAEELTKPLEWLGVQASANARQTLVRPTFSSLAIADGFIPASRNSRTLATSTLGLRPL